MIIDCHMHTPLCGHANGEPEEFVEAAASKGIELITFTCHVPMQREELFRGEGIRMKWDQLPLYHEMVDRAVARGKELGVKVYKGIEAEIYPDPESLKGMPELIRAEPFDFVLGSLHHALPGYRKWIQSEGLPNDQAIVDSYFVNLEAGVRSGFYDSIAHPDVIRIYGTVERFEPVEHEETIRSFLNSLVEAGVCMEVNTSGLIKGVYKLHPDPLILEWASEMGVCLSMGSDAHHPTQVGQHFDEVRGLLEKLGFERLHYFERRQRRSVPLACGIA